MKNKADNFLNRLEIVEKEKSQTAEPAGNKNKKINPPNQINQINKIKNNKSFKSDISDTQREIKKAKVYDLINRYELVVANCENKNLIEDLPFSPA